MLCDYIIEFKKVNKYCFMIQEIKNRTVMPDTSVLINGKLLELIKKGKIRKCKIVISRFVIDELQAQASTGRDIGFRGLESIKEIKKYEKEYELKLHISGRRPTLEEISLAKKGRIDALIRDDALKNKAILITSDYVQALVGEAEGVDVLHVPFKVRKRMKIEKLFDTKTQSVHIKQDSYIYAKKGTPGNMKFVRISKRKITEKEIESIITEILNKVRFDEDSFIEISRHGAMVIQLNEYRISITRPPFSEKTEITIVRPIVKLRLEDYKLHEEIEKRIIDRSRGVIIAGPPGSGKSTFAASIANFLAEKGKIVKTFEQPRDLQVSEEITQYAPLEGDWEKTAELLLLVRPDYTIFDEIRRKKDFSIFADLRLAGVGMIGVVHSNDAISAIQRFIGKLDLGMIPHVIDTIIFMNAGKIEKIYELEMVVKMPSGMTDEDLTRPVVEIRDFLSKELEYEIYTYGEENIVVPVKVSEEEKERIKEQLKQEFGKDVEFDTINRNRVILKVNEKLMPKIIGRKGRRIASIEKKLGLHIDVIPKNLKGKDIDFKIEERGKNIVIRVDTRYAKRDVNVYMDEEFITTVNTGKKAKIKIKKDSDIGRKIMTAILLKCLKIKV